MAEVYRVAALAARGRIHFESTELGDTSRNIGSYKSKLPMFAHPALEAFGVDHPT